jgi:serine/threonine-protein kinase RIM15
MADDAKPTTLAPPAVTALKEEAAASAPQRVQMERTISQDIREERDDLKEAAEHSMTVILELGLDGKIRHVSPSWKDVIGTDPGDVKGKPFQDIIVAGNTQFDEALEAIKKDDSRSQIARFSTRMGPLSALRRRRSRRGEGEETESAPQSPELSQPDEEEQIINLEAQGIMCYDRSTGVESHVSAV